MDARLSAALRRGTERFDAQAYREAHEAWEEGWRSARRGTPAAELLQGLAQCAAAALKLEQGELGGARSLAAKGSARVVAACGAAGAPELAGFARGLQRAFAAEAPALSCLPRIPPPMSRYSVDPDIARASTLPGAFYSDREAFELSKQRVFARAWHFLGGRELAGEPRSLRPVTLLPGFLDEPLLLTRERNGALHVLSNVCTHRGALLVEREGRADGMLCRYHGRRFDLDGRFHSCPGFEGASDFPRPGPGGARSAEDLARATLERLGPLHFAALQPECTFAQAFGDFARRLEWYPFDELVLDPSRSREYLVGAHWALYCDNYLEGFHIPFVHPALNAVLDYQAYSTELFERCNLQVGRARADEACFELPPGSMDHGQRIAGYYWWFFPNLMLNVYPWGVSVNVVEPLAIDRTRVRFAAYVARPELLEQGAGAGLHQVELEDEAVVESVQRGLRARLYPGGRFSPGREQGVHHFQRLLAAAI